jgi:hypothetical protein
MYSTCDFLNYKLCHLLLIHIYIKNQLIQHLQGECLSGVWFRFLRTGDFEGVTFFNVSFIILLGVLFNCPLFM